MIIYKWTKVEKLKNSITNKIEKLSIGFGASEVVSDKTYNAYIDAEIRVTPQDDYTVDEISTIANRYKTDKEWESILTSRIESQKNELIRESVIID